MKGKAVLFLLLASILFSMTQGSGLFSLLTSVGTALVFAAFPIALFRILSLVFLIPLAIVATFEWLIWVGMIAIICIIELCLPLALFAGSGYLLAGVFGASIGTILLITVIIFFGWRSFQVIATTASKGVEWGGNIKEWWFPWPGKVISAIWKLATKVGTIVDSNPIEPVAFETAFKVGLFAGLIGFFATGPFIGDTGTVLSICVFLVFLSFLLLVVLPWMSKILR